MKLAAAGGQVTREIARLQELATGLDESGFDDLAEGCERAIEELAQTMRERDHVETRPRHRRERREEGALRWSD